MRRDQRAENGTFVGVVGVDIDMTKVYERISGIRIYDTGFAALLSKNGELQYSSQDMHIPEGEIQKIISSEENVGTYIERQKRMVLLSRQVKNGDYLLISIAEEDLYINDNRVIFSIILLTMVMSLLIIAALTELLNKMFNRFHTDSLTKAQNRGAYVDMITELDDQIHGRRAAFGLIVFDLNGLKRTNDTEGHAAGDLLLSKAAAEIQRFFPNEDLYRIGGDEFVIISRRDKHVYLTYTFQKFKREMQARKLRFAEDPDSIVLSSGMAIYEPMMDNCYEDVFRRADREMYADKADFYAKNGFLDRRSRR